MLIPSDSNNLEIYNTELDSYTRKGHPAILGEVHRIETTL